MKKGMTKGLKHAHTSNSPKGMGDYYGSGFKNPIGKIRDVMGITPKTSKNLGKAPRSLA